MTDSVHQLSKNDKARVRNVEQLSEIAGKLSSFVRRFKQVVLDNGPSDAVALPPEVADQLRHEQQQLIQGWAALEAEERRVLLGNKKATQSPTAAPKQVTQVASRRSESTLDQAQQFRFLRREHDRKRD